MEKIKNYRFAAKDAIQRVMAYKIDPNVYKKSLNIQDEHFIIIGSCRIETQQQVNLILRILVNSPQVYYVGHISPILEKSLQTVALDVKNRILLVESNNQFEHLRTLDFYFYFYNYKAYAYLLDTSVLILNPFHEKFSATRLELACEFCKEHDAKILSKHIASEEIIGAYLADLGYNERHINLLMHKPHSSHDKAFCEFFDCLLEDSHLKERCLDKFQYRTSHNLLRVQQRRHSFLEVMEK